ncbi:MAG: bifunctional hydroxymethylpyrimidine kinase/phosphomethylpyrimidine kinase [Candidatus Tyrphobacter sp.]
MTLVLSIGTMHPLNTAGVGRDIVVGAELGCTVAAAVAAVSAQDEGAVRALEVLPGRLLREQLECVAEVDAVRVGALGSAENVAVVHEYLSTRSAAVVVDPVRRASTGEPLVDDAAWRRLCDGLANMPTVVLTPNLDEAAALLGRTSLCAGEMEAAAAALRARGSAAVLIKGGHLKGDPVDVLAGAAGVERFESTRIPAAMRGTGCTLAMAIACALGRGSSVRDAVLSARAYLRAKMLARARE